MIFFDNEASPRSFEMKLAGRQARHRCQWNQHPGRAEHGSDDDREDDRHESCDLPRSKHRHSDLFRRGHPSACEAMAFITGIGFCNAHVVLGAGAPRERSLSAPGAEVIRLERGARSGECRRGKNRSGEPPARCGHQLPPITWSIVPSPSQNRRLPSILLRAYLARACSELAAGSCTGAPFVFGAYGPHATLRGG